MPDSGVPDMLLIPKISLFTFARLVGKYAAGAYKDYPEPIWAYHGGRMAYTTPREIVTAVDGEVMRDTSFTVRLSEEKVNFLSGRSQLSALNLALENRVCEQAVNFF